MPASKQFPVRLKIKGPEDAGKQAFYDHLKNSSEHYSEAPNKEGLGLDYYGFVRGRNDGIEIPIVIFNSTNQDSLNKAMEMLDGTPTILVGNEQDLKKGKGKRAIPTQLPLNVIYFSFSNLDDNLLSNFKNELISIYTRYVLLITPLTRPFIDNDTAITKPSSQHKLSKGIVAVAIVNVVGLTIPAIFIAAFLAPNKTSVLGFKVTAELLSISVAVISAILIGDIVCALVRRGFFCNPKANTDATHTVLPAASTKMG